MFSVAVGRLGRRWERGRESRVVEAWDYIMAIVFICQSNTHYKLQFIHFS